jgi:DNA transformation protein and related proteins
MASSQSVVDYIVGQLGPGASGRAMFGEYGVYVRGTLIGLVCDDRLFLKATDAAAEICGSYERAPPYPGAKPAIVVPEEDWADGVLMRRLAALNAAALAKAKPVPKKGAKRSVAKPVKRAKPR